MNAWNDESRNVNLVFGYVANFVREFKKIAEWAPVFSVTFAHLDADVRVAVKETVDFFKSDRAQFLLLDLVSELLEVGLCICDRYLHVKMDG